MSSVVEAEFFFLSLSSSLSMLATQYSGNKLLNHLLDELESSSLDWDWDDSTRVSTFLGSVRLNLGSTGTPTKSHSNQICHPKFDSWS